MSGDNNDFKETLVGLAVIASVVVGVSRISFGGSKPQREQKRKEAEPEAQRIERENFWKEEHASQAKRRATRRLEVEEAEAAGHDVCYECLTIDPDRCTNCSNCTSCNGGQYGLCGSCVSSYELDSRSRSIRIE